LTAIRRRGRSLGGASRPGGSPGGSIPSPLVVGVSIWTRAAIVGRRRGGKVLWC
jgi:hypothetical protein